MKDAQRVIAQMRYSHRELYFILLIFAVLSQTGCALHGRAASPTDPTVVFAEAATLVEHNYIDKTGNKVKIDISMRPDVSTIVAQLDSSNALYSAEDFKTMVSLAEGGIGVFIKLKDGFFEIGGTYPRTPARKAGLHRGDKLIEVEGASLEGLTTAGAMRLLQGKPGTVVALKIKTKSGDEKLLKITRVAVEMPETAAGRIVEKSIGYLRIEAFGPDTVAEVKAVMKRLTKNGIKGLVIDLRNNGGGLLTSVTKVAELFMKRQEVIVKLDNRSDEQQKVIKAWKWFPYTDFPIVVLIDDETAQGAEIIAAALQDTKHALLVGEKSAGKCDLQTMFPLRDGSWLRIRTALAFSPADAPIDGLGLKPDKEVAASKEEQNEVYERMGSFPDLDSVDSPADAQLKAAISLLTEKEKKTI